MLPSHCRIAKQLFHIEWEHARKLLLFVFCSNRLLYLFMFRGTLQDSLHIFFLLLVWFMPASKMGWGYKTWAWGYNEQTWRYNKNMIKHLDFYMVFACFCQPQTTWSCWNHFWFQAWMQPWTISSRVILQRVGWHSCRRIEQRLGDGRTTPKCWWKVREIFEHFTEI